MTGIRSIAHTQITDTIVNTKKHKKLKKTKQITHTEERKNNITRYV